MVTEIETTVNNRPVTHISDKPINFLIGKYNNTRDSFSKTAETDLNSRKRWRQVQVILR